LDKVPIRRSCETPRLWSTWIRSMDFAIHDSSLGKGYPSCDKTYSALLGTKPVEGLVLNQCLKESLGHTNPY
jgi:hypothetical protein